MNKLFIKTLIYIYFSIIDIIYGYLVTYKYILTQTYLQRVFSGTSITQFSNDKTLFNYL